MTTDGESGVVAIPTDSDILIQQTSGSASDQINTHIHTNQPVVQVSLEGNSMATGIANEAVTDSESESVQSSNEEEDEEGEGQQQGRTTDQPSSQRNIIVSVSEPEFQTPRLPNLAQQALERLANAQRYFTGSKSVYHSTANHTTLLSPPRTVEELPDDFQPLKKRRKQEVAQEEEGDEEEVSGLKRRSASLAGPFGSHCMIS